ncbi:amidohydrolase family protein [Candidatus Woesearchaeota archaeon]|nr:amidohydrolase family protein [Candidatus Woesearchaeota archaeon]
MIVDFHCHVGLDLEDGGQSSLEGLKESMEINGIDKSVIFPFSSSDSDLIKNSVELLFDSQKYDCFIPFLRFNPNTITLDELKDLLDMGFKGIKLHPSAQKFIIDDTKFDFIFEELSIRKLPVLFHCLAHQSDSEGFRVLNLAKRFPNVNFIIGHFFGNDLSIIQDCCSLTNVYTEISIHARTLRLNRLFTKYNFTRVLFGSDYPYDSQKVVLTKINESNLDEVSQNKILFGNAFDILDTQKDKV